MNRVQLCGYKSPEIEIHVHASIINGRLKIEGQDIGKNVENFWGDTDYEYYYTLSENDTSKLHEVLNEISNQNLTLLEQIKLNFSGTEGCRNFREFCEEHSIKYEFFSY